MSEIWLAPSEMRMLSEVLDATSRAAEQGITYDSKIREFRVRRLINKIAYVWAAYDDLGRWHAKRLSNRLARAAEAEDGVSLGHVAEADRKYRKENHLPPREW